MRETAERPRICGALTNPGAPAPRGARSRAEAAAREERRKPGLGAPKLEGMPEYIYTLQRVRKAHGDKVVLDDVTLSFLPGAKIGVLGPNGTGKSTLLRMMAGLEQPSNGEAKLMPGFSVGMLQQEPPLNEEKTVLGNVQEGVAETMAMLQRYNDIAEQMATDYSDELLDEMGKLQDQLEHRNAWDLDSQLEQAMDALRCPPPDAEVSKLSGGERRRVALCKLLLEAPDLLLLDEPTNHLDAESVQWLESHLEKYAGTVLAVTHDRYFLDNVATWILELDRGRCYPYEGNYSTYLDMKAQRLKVEGQKDAKRKKRLEDELEWVRSNPKARQTKSKARLQRYEEMAAEADKYRKLDFEEIQIPPGPRLGTTVIRADQLTKGFGERLLMENLTFDLPRNGIVGVIGPNGVGKTTLFRMITGGETPDTGAIVIGDTVKISYADQSRGGIDPGKNVWEVVSDGLDHIKVGNVEMPSRAYIAAFGFKGPDQQKKAGVLSGGERNRLNLALTLKQGGNVLLLDEPTNDLDTETLSSLENALLDFPGCAVITSHDRWFLDRIATHILAWEEGSNWFWFEGNYADYEKNKIERLGADAARPHRVTYRKLHRD
ncbi:energy-dependent translational throttle protein EttA [Nonomuraea monospora]|uniref:Energy-dependent translational throttle protein EttA n=2 Tax=Nonomuraea monospora TaxID=568818 RepID=A0ABN3CAS5_9ACTN